MNVSPLGRGRWVQRPRWARRFLLLHRCHLFWFECMNSYLSLGLDGCLGSLSLLINPIQIELDPKRSTRFVLAVGEWLYMIVDTSIERRDRGAWVLHLLAHQNKVRLLLSPFLLHVSL